MPYTLSHSIIALPVSSISRRKVPIFSVIVGCMAPDLPYLLALKPTNAPGHSLSGVVFYCLPVSLLILFIWYRWIEAPTLDLFGLPNQKRTFSITACVLVVIGILIGGYSHVLWDATSHSSGIIVKKNEFFQQKVFSIPLYKWNQYISGSVGLVSLCFWYLYAFFKNRKNQYQGHFILGLCTYMSCNLFFIILANMIHNSTTISGFAVCSALAIITGIAIAACIYALVCKLKYER